MYAIRSYYETQLAIIRSTTENILNIPDNNQKSGTVNGLKSRITSYNVCYTKLLRLPIGFVTREKGFH